MKIAFIFVAAFFTTMYPAVAANSLAAERAALEKSCKARSASCMSSCRGNIRQDCEICRITYAQCMRHVPLHQPGY